MKNTFPISYSSSTLYNPESNPFEFIARVDLGHACLPSVSHSTTTNSIGKHHFGAPQKPTEYWASRRVVGCGWFGRDETEILLICIMPPDTILILIAFIQEELASPERKQSHRLAVSLLVQFNNPATPFLHISTAPRETEFIEFIYFSFNMTKCRFCCWNFSRSFSVSPIANINL